MKIESKFSKQKELNTNVSAPICFSVQDLQKFDTIQIRKEIQMIFEIFEVRNFVKENEEEANFCIWEGMEEDSSYLEIRVGLDKETHFSTRFLFYVNKQTQEIQILETISGDLMSIEDWRKIQ